MASSRSSFAGRFERNLTDPIVRAWHTPDRAGMEARGAGQRIGDAPFSPPARSRHGLPPPTSAPGGGKPGDRRPVGGPGLGNLTDTGPGQPAGRRHGTPAAVHGHRSGSTGTPAAPRPPRCRRRFTSAHGAPTDREQPERTRGAGPGGSGSGQSGSPGMVRWHSAAPGPGRGVGNAMRPRSSAPGWPSLVVIPRENPIMDPGLIHPGEVWRRS